MVRDLDEQLELKFSENINLNKQINSLNRQLRIIKSTDAVKEVCTIADKKVVLYCMSELHVHNYYMHVHL